MGRALARRVLGIRPSLAGTLLVSREVHAGSVPVFLGVAGWAMVLGERQILSHAALATQAQGPTEPCWPCLALLSNPFTAPWRAAHPRSSTAPPPSS